MENYPQITRIRIRLGTRKRLEREAKTGSTKSHEMTLTPFRVGSCGFVDRPFSPQNPSIEVRFP